MSDSVGPKLQPKADADRWHRSFAIAVFAKGPGPSQLALRPAELVDQEDVGEQRADVDRRVEVVDQLRADAALPEDEPDACLRGRGVALEDLKEAVDGGLGTDALRQRKRAIFVGDAGERVVEAFEKGAKLAA